QLAHRALSERRVRAVALSAPDPPSTARPPPGTHTLATSAQSKPFYYGVLCVAPASVQARGKHWRHVVRAWTEATSAARAEQNAPIAAATVARKLASSTEVSLETLLAATSLLDEFFVRTRAYAEP